jgi:hypothetical protein
VSWALDRRLDFIDDQLVNPGQLRRQTLCAYFGVSLQQASVDLGEFQSRHPGAMRYDASRKRYVPVAAPYASVRGSIPARRIAWWAFVVSGRG